MDKKLLFLVSLACLCSEALSQYTELPAVRYQGEHLTYLPDLSGNNIPDYSYAGYKASEVSIPNINTQMFISHEVGDQTRRIQKAIDYVSALPLDADGFRGAVLLGEGVFELKGGLSIRASGVVLRGSGGSKTTLLGTGLDRTTVVRVHGKGTPQTLGECQVTSVYVPVGTMTVEVSDPSIFKKGSEVVVHRESTKLWIDSLGMNDFGGETGYIGWKPGERDIHWRRTVIGVKGNEIVLDAPLTTALDKQLGTSFITCVQYEGRLVNVGIENLKIASSYDEDNPKDEQHRWMGITMEHVRDAWVRQVGFEHLAGSAVALWNTASRVTVEDCTSQNPVSEIGGWRRYTYYTEGQQSLFQRCYAEYGYHDFGVGFMAAGPNVFVQCKSSLPHSFSGTIDSWASGVLFDKVSVEGQALRFGNRGMEAQGAGWTAANSMFWQCDAALIQCPAPPTAMNWAYGAWSQFSGDGIWHEANSFLNPKSLFYAQLKQRMEGRSTLPAKLLPITNQASSSPTAEQAKAFTDEAINPQIQLIDWIDSLSVLYPIPTGNQGAISVDEIQNMLSEDEAINFQLAMKDGRMLFGNELVTGGKQTVQWWRGNVRAYDAIKAKPHVSRFVPGRIGTGYTDDLKESVQLLKQSKVTILDHNYGLWYDRRRDDHQRSRRMNGEVWAPFYELPFARSGEGLAYDGLSKYDLTKYNDWYWKRLSDFSELGSQHGLVLYHQHYFQHNILEAGGHYADFPWRTANNINDTPFPEPVNYAGDKRVFMAEQFYDVSDPDYRKLHESYIRKCLDSFSEQANVIQFISAEYTGPLAFVRFWLDVIQEWEQETGRDALIALSTTKDVQDAILADKKRSKVVDVIDIRYWHYGQTKSGEIECYAPAGGQNLAPRQHARLQKVPKEVFETVYQSVADYTTQYPDKPVIYHTPRSSAFGWAVLMAGGSMMDIPKIANDQFLREVPSMKHKFVLNSAYYLKDLKTGNQLVYSLDKKPMKIDLKKKKGFFELRWIDKVSGEVSLDRTVLAGDAEYTIDVPETNILWLKRK